MSGSRLQTSGDFLIERRTDVLGGIPVLRGTRIAAHHIADLVTAGASRAEVADELSITLGQVEAALDFARGDGRQAKTA